MKKYIENLIHYELNNNIIEQRDVTYIRNQLYNLLDLTSDGVYPKPDLIKYPSEALNPILNLLITEGKLNDTVIERDLFDAKIMNIFTKLPSVLEKEFYSLNKLDSNKATNYLYNYSISTNYIRMDRILKNESFNYKSNYGNLEITINLSKPEKDPNSIILEGKSVSIDYPKCVLCKENEGFSGNFKRDSRDQLRLLSIDLNDEMYYFQYSPYIYYNEHSIILSEEHRPMVINYKTFSNLLQLTNKFEGYFFGSNADLPIVGGSILSHDHYQGGKYNFPIENAKVIKSWKHLGLDLEIINWPLSTIRLRSDNLDMLAKVSSDILDIWINYNNEFLNIISHTNDIRHNTITPIVRYKNEKYEVDLVLRNNRTTKDFPLGIFHPHSDKWHIKKENIGLIEAMGLAILPGRLKNEINLMKDYLVNNKMHPDLKKHQEWLDKLKSKNYQGDIIDFIKNEIGKVFEKVLDDCGVFKSDNLNQFIKFIEGEINERLFKKTVL